LIKIAMRTLRETGAERNRRSITTGMLSVYDGRRYIGAIIWRGRQGFAAFDAEDRTLGLFPDQKAAMRAVSGQKGARSDE
jgi:hypothetical protein